MIGTNHFGKRAVAFRAMQTPEFAANFEELCRAFRQAVITDHGRVFVFGNGGSASQALHFAAELTGRFKKDSKRPPLPGFALTADTAALTAIANDFGFREVFSRQLEALVSNQRPSKADFVFGLSTSGNSPNVFEGLETAKDLGMTTVALTGENRGLVGGDRDHLVTIPSRETTIIQEAHLAIIHGLCEALEP